MIAPVRDYAWTREKAIAFAEENAIPINVTKRSPFSIDQNVWGRAVETGFLEHLWNAPTKDVYDYTEDPTVNWSARRGHRRIRSGVPVSIDGRPVTVLEAIEELNPRAGAQGVGRLDVVEDRLVGIKSREIYEAPVRWCSSPRTPSSSTSHWSANSAGTSGPPTSVGASWSTTACGTRR